MREKDLLRSLRSCFRAIVAAARPLSMHTLNVSEGSFASGNSIVFELYHSCFCSLQHQFNINHPSGFPMVLVAVAKNQGDTQLLRRRVISIIVGHNIYDLSAGRLSVFRPWILVAVRWAIVRDHNT